MYSSPPTGCGSWRYPMRYICLPFLLLLLLRCASAPREHTPEVQDVIQIVAKECGVKFKGSVFYERLSESWIQRTKRAIGWGGTVGYCNYATGSVTLDKAWFASHPEDMYEEVLLHEIGHCALGRWMHNNELFPDGCNRSIMNEFTSSRACYLEHREEMLHELCD